MDLPSYPDRGRGIVAAKRGDGIKAARNFTVKAYRSGAVVCNDFPTLVEFLSGEREALLEQYRDFPEILIDDAGIGCPLGGTMLGIYGEGVFLFDVVPVAFFRKRGAQKYLHEQAQRGEALLDRLGAQPERHRISICPGWSNVVLRDRLRLRGFRVDLALIEDPLQTLLEEEYGRYIESLGYNGYVDPKGVPGKTAAQAYYAAVRWGREHAPQQLKTMFRGL